MCPYAKICELAASDDGPHRRRGQVRSLLDAGADVTVLNRGSTRSGWTPKSLN